MTTARRRLLLVFTAAAVLLAGALLVLLRDDEPDTRTGSPTSTGPPATSPVVFPLLGTPGEPPDRAALGVKIDNTDNGRPPTGLRQADVVFEEVVEGGLTRLLAVYHSEDPDEVGPVRSARSTDLAVLAELGRPLFAWSGANPTFRAAVEAADLADVGFAAVPDAYWREGDRRAPYNLFADPAELRAAVDAGSPPPMLFAYRAAGEPLAGPGVQPATGFRASTFATSIEWTWNARTRLWERTQNGTPHVDTAGDRVAVPNVVVRTTPYRDSGVRDSTGAVVPEAAAVGEGDAWLLSDGKAQPARWSKAADDAPTLYTTAGGQPLELTPGQTWVEILPPGTGTVV
jgi:hypothetical protein